jgi:hypothetical protein
MDAKLRTPSGREIPVNPSGPTGLLLGEACVHISHNALIRQARRPTGLFALGAAFLLLGVANPLGLLELVLGAGAAYTLLASLYLCWYGRFVHLNNQRRPLCPCCTSRWWQFCCTRCCEPVPPLAFMMRGLLLAHCPHCGLSLSCRRGSLKAWCSTCGLMLPRPDLLYGRPTLVAVLVLKEPRQAPAGEWRPVQMLGNRPVFYHPGDAHSASILCLCTPDDGHETPAPEHLMAQVRMVLMEPGIHEVYASRLKGFFGPDTIWEST